MKMTESIWSKEAPTEPGYYWAEFRDDRHEIVKVVDYDTGRYWQIHGVQASRELQPWQSSIIQWGQRVELWNPPPKEEPEFDQTDEIVDIMEYRREVSRKRLLKQLERDGLKGKE